VTTPCSAMRVMRDRSPAASTSPRDPDAAGSTPPVPEAPAATRAAGLIAGPMEPTPVSAATRIPTGAVGVLRGDVASAAARRPARFGYDGGRAASPPSIRRSARPSRDTSQNSRRRRWSCSPGSTTRGALARTSSQRHGQGARSVWIPQRLYGDKRRSDRSAHRRCRPGAARCGRRVLGFSATGVDDGQRNSPRGWAAQAR
jgi:hypothetical protein